MGFVWKRNAAVHGSSVSCPELLVLVEFIIYLLLFTIIVGCICQWKSMPGEFSQMIVKPILNLKEKNYEI